MKKLFLRLTALMTITLTSPILYAYDVKLSSPQDKEKIFQFQSAMKNGLLPRN